MRAHERPLARARKLLDDLRLGNIELTQQVLDLLFRGVDALRAHPASRRGAGSGSDIEISSAGSAGRRRCGRARLGHYDTRSRAARRAHRIRGAPPAHQHRAGAEALSPARGVRARDHRRSARRPEDRANRTARSSPTCPPARGDADSIELDILMASEARWKCSFIAGGDELHPYRRGGREARAPRTG